MPYVAPQSYGLMGGIGNALSSGVQTYLEAKKQNQDQANQQSLLGLKAQEAGYNFNPDSQQFEPGQGLLNKQQLGNTQTQSELDSYDPNSQVSANSRTQAKAIANGIKPGYGDKIITDDMSDADIQKQMGLLGIGLKAAGGEQRIEAAAPAKAAKASSANDVKAYQDFSKTVQPFKQSMEEAENLKALAQDATSNPSSANAIGVYMARYASHGSRINRQEIEALGQGEKDILGRASQIAQQGASGTLTPDNAAFAQKFIDVTSGTAKQNYLNAAKDKADEWANLNGVSPQTYYDKFGITNSRVAKQGQFAPQQQAQSGGFPRTVTNGTHQATVNSQSELDEANQQGFK